MKKFVFIKNKVFYSTDALLEKNFGDNFQPAVLTLPTIPYLAYVVDLLVVVYIEFFYKNRGVKKLIYEYCDNGDNSRWIIDHNEYKELGKKVLTDKIFVNNAIKDFKLTSEKYYREISKLEKHNINSKALLQNFLKLTKLYITEFAINYSVTGPVTLGYGDVAIKKILAKYNNSRQIKKAVNILTKPRKDFLSREKEDLERLAGIANKLKITTLANLKIDAPCLYRKLVDHQKKYYWISNNYKNTKYLELEYFFDSCKKIFYTPKSIRGRKSPIRRRVNFRNIEKADINTLKLFGKIALLHDDRKKANMIANYWLIEYAKHISKRTGVSISVLKFASLWELVDLLNGKIISIKKIAKRRKGCMRINIPGREYWLTGREYKKFFKKIDLSINKEFNQDVVSGLTAYYGKIKGRVKIIINIKKDGKKLKKGDVLVTSMTRPEFMPLAKKARAILTDEGGITSHAAIISRELKIPCIVGTKNATKILKDGDLVEVDADKGVVKILK
ncbi:hypothetical protein KKC83_06090 [Patescibacteria group bacterium]|nr:hypothetical protein [Patescibacteria group bacterium]MBU4014744.1 hypothetical protein [Patescibacteria group bacterium]MBU4027082.1 hypothetical protein [Patescibacteria group bacterium]MBU4073625.1 hypothetical protein [Patescibacteria group bacterium]MBU4102898.1 hypothetical protein [Patescibacteria group bacterium]